MGTKKFPKVPKEAIVRPEDEKPAKTEVRPEGVESKDEAEQKQLHPSTMTWTATEARIHSNRMSPLM